MHTFLCTIIDDNNIIRDHENHDLQLATCDIKIATETNEEQMLISEETFDQAMFDESGSVHHRLQLAVVAGDVHIDEHVNEHVNDTTSPNESKWSLQANMDKQTNFDCTDHTVTTLETCPSNINGSIKARNVSIDTSTICARDDLLV